MAVMQVDFVSQCLMRTVTIKVILPLDKIAKMNGEKAYVPEKFKTLYLLHGMLGNHTDWIDGTRIQRWAQEKNLAVVMPAGENRFYVDNPREGAYFGEYIGRELVEMTRKMFPLSEKREDTFIAGLSMGGYGALNAGLTYPETFGKVAALSAALRPWKRMDKPQGGCVQRPAYARALFGQDTEPWNTLTLARQCGARAPELWLSCGAQDDLLEESIALVDGLRQAGIPAHFDQPPGAHNWDFWDREIQRVIDWLMP